MEFFNKKEEVLDFKLTEYGKYLLTIGRLKPSYYCFFDDDILYDSAAGGFTENQNESEGRIQSTTPSVKVIPTRTGAEARVSSFVQEVSELLGPNSDPSNKVDVFSRVEVFEDKGKIGAHPLGRSSLDSPYDPAWSVQMLAVPEISSSVPYLNIGYNVVDGVRQYTAGTRSGSLENIPQINIDVDYKMFYEMGNDEPDDIDDAWERSDGEQTHRIPETDIRLIVENNYLLLEVIENNTEFEKENFDIEVYHSGSDGRYVQLAYSPTDTKAFISPRPIENSLNIPGNIEYYMDIFVDDEISDSTYAAHNVPSAAVMTNASRLVVNRDIYEPEPEDPC